MALRIAGERDAPASARCAGRDADRVRSVSVFCTTILGNAAEWSCCFSAILTATLRAISR